MDAWRKVGPASNLNLNGKREEITFLGLYFRIGTMGGVRERNERKSSPSLYDLRRSGGRNLLIQDLKFIYSMRAARGYQQHIVSPKISGLEKKI